MRFCTSRPLITITASTRLSDSGRNSIWLSDWWGWRGIVTTPARCVSEDSICEATATSALGSRSASCSSRWFNSFSMCASSGRCRCRNSVSTKKR